MAQGKIKSLNPTSGHGFIASDGASTDLYFQRDSVEGGAFDRLKEGQRVDFTIAPDPIKADPMRAEHIRPTD